MYMFEPGEGAVEYAKNLTDGMTRKQATRVIRELLKRTDLKRCATCGYPFEDKTKNKSAKVCGQSCKSVRKTTQKRNQRQKKAERGKGTPKPIYYQWWHEYPFWTNEYMMLNRAANYERPFSHTKLTMISAARQRAELMGGRKGRRHSKGYVEQY